MKTTLVILSTIAFMSSSAFGSSSINFEVKVHSILTMKKTSRNSFEKISDTASGTASLNYISNGQRKNIISKAINTSDTVNAVSFEVEGKNLLRVIDQKENIDRQVPAEINKSLFGNIKEITIKAKTLEVLYAESIENSGIDILRGLHIPGTRVNFSSDVTFSDEVCKRDGDLLICNQDSLLKISIAD